MASDFPFDDIIANCTKLVAQGVDIYQKFSCSSCLSRQTMAEPNIIYSHGRCEECGSLTDIREQGCNYLAELPGKSSRRRLEVHIASDQSLTSAQRKH